MDYELTGRRAVVLGASRGLGAACAVMLAGEGAKVLALSRSGTLPVGASKLAAGRITVRAIDLSEPKAVADLCAEAAESTDILVNNSGGPAAGPARGQSTETWRAAFETMALPLFALSDAALTGITARTWGRIVTIGSSGIEAPIPNLVLSNGHPGLGRGLVEDPGGRGRGPRRHR